jgi:hypothetical protein
MICVKVLSQHLPGIGDKIMKTSARLQAQIQKIRPSESEERVLTSLTFV